MTSYEWTLIILNFRVGLGDERRNLILITPFLSFDPCRTTPLSLDEASSDGQIAAESTSFHGPPASSPLL